LKQLEGLNTRLGEASIGVSPDDLRAIFRNLNDIIRHQTKLVQDINTASSTDKPLVAVSRVLCTSFGDRSSAYVPFVQSSSSCTVALAKYNKNSKVQKEITIFCAQSALSGKNAVAGLEDALKEPYRHLFQLKSCLEHVRSGFAKGSEQWTAVNRVIDRCSGVISQLDEATIQSEQVKELFFLKQCFAKEDVGSVVSYLREFLYDGGVHVVSFTPAPDHPSDTFKVHQRYHLFVFSDELLFCLGKRKNSSQKRPLKIVSHEPIHSVVAAHNVCLQKSSHFSVKCASGDLELEVKNSERMQKWMSIITRAVLSRKRTLVIGASLSDLLQRPGERNNVVPAVIEHALQCIEKYGLEQEGIFRIARSQTELNELQRIVDSGRQPSFVDPVLASVFVKRWLTSLPQPLLLTKRKDTEWFDVRDDASKLQMYVEELGRINSSVLYRVVDVLNQVAARQEVNRMSIGALSIIFGAVLFNVTDPNLTVLSSETVQALLENADKIFTSVRASELTRKSSLKNFHRVRRMNRIDRSDLTILRSMPTPLSPTTKTSSFTSHPLPRNV